MRIAHFDTRMNWGGQELRVIEQIEWLNTHGHQAWVIARPKSKIIKEAQKRNLPHFELPIRGSTNPKTIFQLHAFLKREISIFSTYTAIVMQHTGLLLNY